MNLREFNRRIRRIAGGVPENTERLLRMAAFAAHQGVVLATPVDTGRARSNWTVTNGAPARSETDNVSRSPQGTIDRGREVIGQHQPGEVLYITNNVPYIGRLNEGWSAQAPANFVQAAVAQARALIANTRIVR
jgi:hypothetical protein